VENINNSSILTSTPSRTNDPSIARYRSIPISGFYMIQGISGPHEMHCHSEKLSLKLGTTRSTPPLLSLGAVRKDFVVIEDKMTEGIMQ